ncbi:MAG TPA: hypothetical protein PLT31_07330, partial [Fibrobacteraceae bacterium]|nr:hypothetical protein [Fibrobacteraceae bacterium]
MKKATKILLLITFLSISFVNAETTTLQGLWKYYGNVFDGSVKRFDNINISVKNDSVHFYINETQSVKGFLRNDTIFVEQGSELYFIEWIRIVNKDSLISSISANNSIEILSFSRLDLNGEWEQHNKGRSYSEPGVDGLISTISYKDTCTIVQEKDSVFFYESSDFLAKGYL